MEKYKFILFYLMCGLVLGSIIYRRESNVIDTKYVYASKEIIAKYDVLEGTEDIYSDIDIENVIETRYGKLSRYGPDCYGCSGYLAYGKYVGDGTIYYNDNLYGNVRILAGDKYYPFGTIVRISYNNESFLGIVLDRGGAIGFNKSALFDLLYSSEYLANIDGINYNVKFEILRIGF